LPTFWLKHGGRFPNPTSGLGASFIVLNNALRIGEGAGSLAFLDSQTFAIEPERMWELSHRPAKTLPLLPMVLSALRQVAGEPGRLPGIAQWSTRTTGSRETSMVSFPAETPSATYATKWFTSDASLAVASWCADRHHAAWQGGSAIGHSGRVLWCRQWVSS
jgi:hypothetical protein